MGVWLPLLALHLALHASVGICQNGSANTVAARANGTLSELELHIREKSAQAVLWKLFEDPESFNASACPWGNDTNLPPYRPKGVFLLVSCNGGLTQQRAAIINSVALARFLNFTLILPFFSENPVWQDSSQFSDLYDLPHFEEALRGIVELATRVPKPHTKLRIRAPSNESATLDWYSRNVLTRIAERKDGPVQGNRSSVLVVLVNPFARRLANNLPKEFQRLRCYVNMALRFSPSLLRIADSVKAKIRASSSSYVAVHMRFEVDAVAYSMCNFGGNESEALKEYRRTRWDTPLRRDREALDPVKQRRLGQCPISPVIVQGETFQLGELEAGVFLRAMGFTSDTPIYVAAMVEHLYPSEKALEPLRMLFPRTLLKRDLLTDQDGNLTAMRASSWAAVDYELCISADVFVPTATGNFPNFVAGHRVLSGYRKTIQPDLKKLALAYSCGGNKSWASLLTEIRQDHWGRIGGPSFRPFAQNFFANPSDCMCGH